MGLPYTVVIKVVWPYNVTVSCTAGAVTTVKSTLGFLEVGVVLISSVGVVVGDVVA